MTRTFAVNHNNHKATVTITWAEESRWSSAHYNAHIKVPYKPSITHNLFVYDKANIEEAIYNAVQYAKGELETCTLI